MWLEMKVKGFALDPLSNMPMIILRDEEEKRSLPIWEGLFEANAIALELEKISTPRPMTHDLINSSADGSRTTTLGRPIRRSGRGARPSTGRPLP